MTESLESIRIRAGKRIAAALHISAAASAVETRALARHVLDCDDTELIMRAGQQIAASDQKRIAELVGRRVKGEPIAHLTGSREFYGVHLACSPAALIPRPETELVVDLALARLAPAAVGPIADLGAGCGAITAAIAANRSNLTIDAYERDRPAAQLAARNVRIWSGRVKIIGRSWQQIKSAAYRLIVANPPYLTSAETAAALANGSLRDPIAALDGGSDGLDSLRSAIDAARRGLRQGGWLIIEHGYRQQDAVGGLLVDAGFGQIGSHCDLAGWPRVAVAQRNRI